MIDTYRETLLEKTKERLIYKSNNADIYNQTQCFSKDHLLGTIFNTSDFNSLKLTNNGVDLLSDYQFFDDFKFLENKPIESLNFKMINEDTFHISISGSDKENLKKTMRVINQMEVNKLLKDHFGIRMSSLSSNILNSIKLMNIDKSLFDKFQYEEPYYQHEHYALVPLMTLIKKEHKDKYKNILELDGYFNHICFKDDWFYNNEEKDDFFNNYTSLDNISKSPMVTPLFGSGFTIGTLPSDGYLEQVFVILDYGEYKTVCIMHLWHNK